MITFVVVTSIINIAAGYALALFLGAERPYGNAGAANASDASAASAANAAQLGEMISPAGPAIALTPSPAATPLATPAGATAAHTLHQEPQASEFETLRSEVDQDLLAGIEEFRNQLAQLKAKGATDDSPVALVSSL